MNYIIIDTKDYQTGQELSIVKDGNTYDVDFTDGNTFITKKFRDKETPMEIYKTMTEWFIKGWYSFEDRKDYILKGNYPLPF